MALWVSGATRALVARTASADGMLLGILGAKDEILLVEASPRQMPGHRDWLLANPILIPKRGFSIGFYRGRVDFHRPSQLNPADQDNLIESELADEIIEVLALRQFGIVRVHAH